jgi:hypothetical protein
MSLIDDQLDGSKTEYLGRFVVAVIAACEVIVEESPTTPNHAARMALAKRMMIDGEAQKFGHSMLRLALARLSRTGAQRAEPTDAQIMQIVTHYIGIFSAGGW